MKSHKLARFVIPIPPPKPVCAACKAWSPEVTMPVGDGAVDLCWLCAHHHVDHGATLDQTPTAQCECTAAEIYPPGHREAKATTHARSEHDGDGPCAGCAPIPVLKLRPVITATSCCEPLGVGPAGAKQRDIDRARQIERDVQRVSAQSIPRWRSRGK